MERDIEQLRLKEKTNVNVGVLGHVDSGKTRLGMSIAVEHQSCRCG